jgi:hypothetical protein
MEAAMIKCDSFGWKTSSFAFEMRYPQMTTLEHVTGETELAR